jgi:hypothetical protein
MLAGHVVKNNAALRSSYIMGGMTVCKGRGGAHRELVVFVNKKLCPVISLGSQLKTVIPRMQFLLEACQYSARDPLAMHSKFGMTGAVVIKIPRQGDTL